MEARNWYMYQCLIRHSKVSILMLRATERVKYDSNYAVGHVLLRTAVQKKANLVLCRYDRWKLARLVSNDWVR
jgi:hypothetical protein